MSGVLEGWPAIVTGGGQRLGRGIPLVCDDINEGTVDDGWRSGP